VVLLVPDPLRRGIWQGLIEHGAQVDPIAHSLRRFVDTVGIGVGLSGILHNYEHMPVGLVQAAEYAEDDVAVLLVGLVGVAYAVEAYGPLPRGILHEQPGVTLVEFAGHLYAVADAFDGLVIGPVASEFDVFLLFFELNVASGVKVFG